MRLAGITRHVIKNWRQKSNRLVDAHGYEGTGEAHQQDARSCCGDQGNQPRVAAPASQIEVSGAAKRARRV